MPGTVGVSLVGGLEREPSVSVRPVMVVVVFPERVTVRKGEVHSVQWYEPAPFVRSRGR
jgi:hypothetical protein